MFFKYDRLGCPRLKFFGVDTPFQGEYSRQSHECTNMLATPTIFVVEDNRDLNELLVQEFVANGYTTRGYFSGASCLADIAEAQVFLVDLNLPDIDGITLVLRIRQTLPKATIIVLSARSGTDERVAGYEAGCNVYLQKPCSAREILLALRSQLRHAGLADEGDLLHSPTTLHLSGKVVIGSDGAVTLTEGERCLLQALSRSQDGLSYQEVARIIAGGRDLSRGSLEVRIVRLRQKLSKAMIGTEMIRSRRNFGYVMEVALTE